MRPFHRFIIRMVIGFFLVFLVATALQRTDVATEPHPEPLAALSLEA